jgi:hypothetical protein
LLAVEVYEVRKNVGRVWKEKDPGDAQGNDKLASRTNRREICARSEHQRHPSEHQVPDEEPVVRVARLPDANLDCRNGQERGRDEQPSSQPSPAVAHAFERSEVWNVDSGAQRLRSRRMIFWNLRRSTPRRRCSPMRRSRSTARRMRAVRQSASAWRRSSSLLLRSTPDRRSACVARSDTCGQVSAMEAQDS